MLKINLGFDFFHFVVLYILLSYLLFNKCNNALLNRKKKLNVHKLINKCI